MIMREKKVESDDMERSLVGKFMKRRPSLVLTVVIINELK